MPTLTGYEIETLAPRPGPRLWATATTSYVQAEGPEFEPDESGAKRWLFGVQFTPFGCEKSVGVTLDPFAERETSYVEMGDAIQFYPFIAETAVERSVLSGYPEDLVTYVQAHTEAARSSIMGAQVERSLYTTENPSLASEAQDVSGGDSSLMGAVYYVEEALADLLDGGAGMIHMTPGLFTLFSQGGGVRYDALGRPFTQTGHIIVADAGYIGASPHELDAVAGELWVYGSGPVVGHYDNEVTIAADDDSFYKPRNMLRIDAEQYGIAFFDPCGVVAAVVGLGDDNITAGPVGS